jgi:tetratricopeptide (TPR) repeat protein
MGIIPSKLSNGTDQIKSEISNDTQNFHSKRVANTRQKPLQNVNEKFVIVWVDPNINDSDPLYRNSIARLRRISVSINTFTNINDCVLFLIKTKDVQILMVIDEDLIKEIWPRIQSMTHIYSIYILSNNIEQKEYLKQEYPKIKGIYNKIDLIYGLLKRDTRQYHQEILVMSIIPSANYSKKDLKELNQLFIYWFLVKQIILNTKYDKDAHKKLAEFCRNHYLENNNELKIIDEFENTYHDHTPIWWYTRECFIYIMLNRALQTQDIEVIIRMGCFIQDLHQQLEQLQKNNEDLYVVYRCQNATIDDFEKMKTSEGNLLSFNNLMLASTDYKTSLEDTRRARINPNAVGVLFRIETGFESTSTPFASLKNLSYFPEKENNLLFSMHSVFRIGQIKQIEERVWQINLTLTENNDKQMTSLHQLIQEETQQSIGWYKLAKLMVTIRDFDHAKEIYFVLLDLLGENDSLKKSHIYNELGLISDELGDYTLSLQSYQKAIELRKKCLPPNHRLLSVAYNNIGEVQRELGEYYSALSSHKKTLSIKQKTLPPNHLSFATTYNNLGLTTESLGQYSTALQFYQKAVDIKRQVRSPYHSELAVTYNNIGELQREMGNFPVALKYFEKVLNIRLKTAYPYDSTLAITYNNMGLIHREMGDYSQAISYFEKSLEIKSKTFSSHHPSLAITYNNIGDINQQMGQFSQAILSYEKALEIQEKAFSLNHPDVATTYNNIGVAHQSLGNYSIASSFFQKALKIRQKSLPANHPSIGTLYNNIGHLHQLMGDYNTALEYYQKTQKLQEKALNPNHPSLASSYNNIADIQRKLGNNKAALQLYRKSLNIKKESLTENHPALLITYNNIGVLHQAMEEYSTSLEYYKKTLEIQEKTLSSDHPDFATIYNNMGVAYQSMKEYSTALENYEKALKIQEKCLPKSHPDLATTHNSIATILVDLGDLKKALEHEQRAVDIASQSFSADHPNLVIFKDYLQRIQLEIESL